MRSLRAGEGFLSQSSKWIHFGLGDESQIARLEITWPGGESEIVKNIAPNRRYTIKQGDAVAQVVELPKNSQTAFSNQATDQKAIPSQPSSARIVLTGPLELPELPYVDPDENDETVSLKKGDFKLINLWASWCSPCVRELEELNRHYEGLQQENVEVLALNVDHLEQNRELNSSSEDAQKIAGSLRLKSGFATEKLIGVLDVVQRALLDQQRPITLPMSFLLDDQQRLLVIYKGAVSSKQLFEDVAKLRENSNDMPRLAVPFPGRWHNRIDRPDSLQVAMRMIEIGDLRGASDYLQRATVSSTEGSGDPAELIATKLFLARLFVERNARAEAISTFRQVLQLDPNHMPALLGISLALIKSNREDESIAFLERALQRDATNSKAMAYFAMARLQQGNGKSAADWYRQALTVRPDWLEVLNNLAWLLSTDPDPMVRNGDEAIRLATRMCEITNYQIPGMLDTLAAAYANSGQFSKAIKTIDRASKIAKSRGQAKLLEKLTNRRALYIAGQAFRVSD